MTAKRNKVRVYFYITPQQNQKIEQLVQATNMTKSEHFRRALDLYLEMIAAKNEFADSPVATVEISGGEVGKTYKVDLSAEHD
jgi:hypothetical protein